MVSQQIANLPRVYALSAFESRRLRHVAVAQLVERQIVALHVVDSNSTGHPMIFFIIKKTENFWTEIINPIIIKYIL